MAFTGTAEAPSGEQNTKGCLFELDQMGKHLYTCLVINPACIRLPLRTVVIGAVHNWFVYVNVAVPDFKVITAIRIGTDPGFIMNRRPLVAEIG